MTLSPEQIKVLLEDPRRWLKEHYEVDRPKIERLLLQLLFEPDTFLSKYILEVPSPPKASYTAFIKTLVDSINKTIRMQGEILDSQLQELTTAAIQKNDITNANEILTKYEDYYKFLIAADNHKVITKKELDQTIEIKNQVLNSILFKELLRPIDFVAEKERMYWKKMEQKMKKAIAPLECFLKEDDKGEYLHGATSKDTLLLRNSTSTFYRRNDLNISSDLDVLNYSLSDNSIIITNLYLIEGSLKNAKDIIINELYTKVAAMHMVGSAFKFPKEPIYYILLVDTLNYVGLVKLTKETIKTCVDKFSKDLVNIERIQQKDLFYNYPTFEGNYCEI